MNVIASMTETASFAYSGLSAALLSLPLLNDRIYFENSDQTILLIGLAVAPFVGSIASQFANPKTTEKEAANSAKKPLNINRMVTRGAFSLAASSLVGIFFAGIDWNEENRAIVDSLSGLLLTGIGSLSALVEKYAFKE